MVASRSASVRRFESSWEASCLRAVRDACRSAAPSRSPITPSKRERIGSTCWSSSRLLFTLASSRCNLPTLSSFAPLLLLFRAMLLLLSGPSGPVEAPEPRSAPEGLDLVRVPGAAMVPVPEEMAPVDCFLRRRGPGRASAACIYDERHHA